MPRLNLTNGGVALVDAADFNTASKFLWWRTPQGYPRNRKLGISLHQFIFGKPPGGLEVDHIDGNKLDCRRKNLRFCTRSQNQANSRKRAGTPSRFKGVTPSGTSWRAQIQFQNRKVMIGSWVSERVAAQAYDVVAVSYFGEFSRLNYPRLKQAYLTRTITLDTLRAATQKLKVCQECGRTYLAYLKGQKICRRLACHKRRAARISKRFYNKSCKHPSS